MFIKIKILGSLKDTIKKTKRQATAWGKIFAGKHTIKEYVQNVQRTLNSQYENIRPILKNELKV